VSSEKSESTKTSAKEATFNGDPLDFWSFTSVLKIILSEMPQATVKGSSIFFNTHAQAKMPKQSLKDVL